MVSRCFGMDPRVVESDGVIEETLSQPAGAEGKQVVEVDI
jgi:hypothetical protein